jgi:signal transduction histidine kinase
MKLLDRQWIQGLLKLLAVPRSKPTRETERIVAMQLHIVLPAKIGVAVIALYYLFSDWSFVAPSTYLVVLETLQKYFFVYILCNVAAGTVYCFWRRLPGGIFQWLVFTFGLLDGLFVAGLAFMTEGFQSMAYWLFPGLILLNAISIPLATPQIVLNLLLSFFYVGAGVLEVKIPPGVLTTLTFTAHPTSPRPVISPRDTNRVSRSRFRTSNLPTDTTAEAKIMEPDLPRLFVLWLLTACCYGVQVLAERRRRELEEAREFAVREGQLHSAGRLAAEIAHQLKNPLSIINNAAFSLHRALKEGKPASAGQIQIIQEEIDRADRILTDLMGYAQLSEGRVEKLSVSEEVDRAIEQVFPRAVNYGITVERHYDSNLPPLLMQRRHLAGILVNLLQNAREVLNGSGSVAVTASYRSDDSVEITISDSGPGIPTDKVERIFEPYYTTRQKGTGLGLAIVKHNVELYAGTVRAESGLGKGARFVLTFPAKAAINPAAPT